LRRIRFRAIQLAVVAVLAAAGVVAATALAGGTGSNHTTTKNGTGGGSHNTNKETTSPASEETTDTPPPPPPPTTTPPDPLAPPGTAPNTPARPPDKAQAGITARELRSILLGVATFLGDCLTPSEGGSDTTDPVLCFVAAQAIIVEALAEYKLYLDPPDPNFMQVTLGVASRVPQGGFRCAKTVKKNDCAAVTAALRTFLVALTTNAEASRGSGVTLERYSGAVQAHSVPGALLQSAAQKAYAGLTVSTKAAQQAAGVALGLALRKAHLERLPTRTQFQARVTKLRSKGLPRQFIQRLIAAKTITSTADLDAWLSTFKSPVPYMSPSQALSRPLPTAASAALWRTMTVKDLAVLIRGLVAQGALPAAFGNMLLGELRTIANTPSAEARKPLIAKLAADCGAITGPAGVLLAAGANGLS
jgi:hypothetical protein